MSDSSMKTTSLILISIFIVGILAGVPHIFAHYGEFNATVPSLEATPISVSEPDTLVSPEVSEAVQSPLSGTWKASYQSEDFTGEVLYQFRSEANTIRAYSTKISDQTGSMDDNSLVLIVQSFTGEKGDGRYVFEYEGKQEEVSCKLKLLDNGHLQISYDYYGYGDTETWYKITK